MSERPHVDPDRVDLGPASDEREIDRSDLERLLRLATPRPAIPAERAARVEATARDRWLDALRARRRRRLLTTGLAAAATLLLATLGWYFIGFSHPTGTVAWVERVTGEAHAEGKRSGSPSGLQEAQRLDAGTVLVTRGDGRLAVSTGGASLRIDRDSRVRLVDHGVVELLEGGLYIDSPELSDDLVVRTRWGAVEEIGTQFEVRSDGEGLRVRVREGAVVLRTDQASFEASGDDPESGVELALDAEGDLDRRSISRYGRSWDWVASIAPAFPMEGRTLADFLDWFSRETGRAVRFADTELAASAPKVDLHGSGAGLTPEEALTAVLETTRLVHRLVGADVEIARRTS